MFEISYPLFFLLLPLPFLVYKFIKPYETKKNAIRAPFFSMLLEATDEKENDGIVMLKPNKWQKIFFIFSWFMILLSLSKPMMLGEPETRELSGRDVMFILDLSGSMSENDFELDDNKISRLDASKKVLKDFAKGRKGDRFGLIVFGDNAYLQSPFTSDYKVWTSLLEETEVAMAGQSTRLGDAIGLGIKVFHDENNETKEKVLIVLTDGNDTDSLVPPVEASIVAKSKDIKIHMVAMGDPTTKGEQKLDMNVIKEVANNTGGLSFQALSSVELERAYDEISKIEEELYESFTYQPKVSIHQVPMQIVLILFLFLISLEIINKRIRRKNG